MRKRISHDRADESPEAKARWFQSLTVAERMEILCAFTDLALAANPHIADRKNAEQARKGVRILTLRREDDRT